MNRKDEMGLKIYTSYFGNLKKLRANRILAISIAQYPPKFFNGPSIKELAPRGYMLSPTFPPHEYEKIFKNEILGMLNQHSIVKKIEIITKNFETDLVALCCFEKHQNECHREYVAEWLNKAGYEVVEFGGTETPKLREVQEDNPVQTELF